MNSQIREVAIGLASKLEAPMEIVMPVLLECRENDLPRYVTLMFEAQRNGRWDAFADKKNTDGRTDDQLDQAELAPGADVAGFLSSSCPLLVGSHLPLEDQTWAVWMMYSGYKLMEAGESFQAHLELESGWETALASALDHHGIRRGRALSAVLARLESAEKSRRKPPGIRWYLNRKIDDDDETSHAAALVAYANIGLMFDEGDRYDARYRMRDLYGVCRRSYKDQCSFAEFNAWVWNRERKAPYQVPKHGRDTKELLGDLRIWSSLVAPAHREVTALFVDGFLSGSIDVKVVRGMRQASLEINRSHLVENKDPETRYHRAHLYVCRIHNLLDNIEHMSPTVATTTI